MLVMALIIQRNYWYYIAIDVYTKTYGNTAGFNPLGSDENGEMIDDSWMFNLLRDKLGGQMCLQLLYLTFLSLLPAISYFATIKLHTITSL